MMGGNGYIGRNTIQKWLRCDPDARFIVNPTLVYGNGRTDSLTKMVPLLKFLGIFNKNMKPVTVNEVAEELVSGMCE